MLNELLSSQDAPDRAAEFTANSAIWHLRISGMGSRCYESNPRRSMICIDLFFYEAAVHHLDIKRWDSRMRL